MDQSPGPSLPATDAEVAPMAGTSASSAGMVVYPGWVGSTMHRGGVPLLIPTRAYTTGYTSHPPGHIPRGTPLTLGYTAGIPLTP